MEKEEKGNSTVGQGKTEPGKGKKEGQPNYQKTLFACYLGFITQAIAANFAPLLFLTFHKTYRIPLGKIALISTVFYFTQLLVDLICARFVDSLGYRRSAVFSEIFSGVGLVGLAVVPELFSDPFIGIMLCVFVYAVGSGLIEVLVSPMVEACPFENKDSVMSLLHSFYCWGSVGVILLSTIFFWVFGIQNWKWLAFLWALLPFSNCYRFATCPIERLTEEGEGMTIGGLCRVPLFWLAVLLMFCAGACELSMAQWASAYTEAALGFPKTVGDLLGPCLFAVTMGISRLIYGKWGEKLALYHFMLGSGLLCLCCYLVSSLSTLPMVGLLGCIFCGFSVGILWPGTIRMVSPRLPQGGTALFALMAMAGDLGGSCGPSIVGRVAAAAGDNLQAGLLVGCVFPLALLVALLMLGRNKTGSE